MKTSSYRTLGATLSGLLLAFSLSACDSRADKAELAALEAEAAEAKAEQTKPAPPKVIYVAAKPKPEPVCSNCGTITHIETRKEKGDGSGFGAVAGAVAGAVIGHQIGSGRGNDAATAAGAIGGGFAGHEIEKRAKSTTYYRVTVSMDAGGTRTVDVGALNGLSSGSKVKVIGNNLQVAG